MSTGIIVGIVVAVIEIGGGCSADGDVAPPSAGAAVRPGIRPGGGRARQQARGGSRADRARAPVEDLDIQPLTDSARASYAGQWTSIQEQFVDAPADTVSGAQLLVAAVMTERGYPAEDDEQVLADLSVEHSAPWTATGPPRRSASGPPRARPPPRTCGKPWSTTVPCSVTSSASPRIPDPGSAPRPSRTGERAIDSLNLTRRRWRNDLTKRAGH